jgi:hypothetical protein
VDLTLLRVHLTHRHVRLELVPEALPPCPPTSVRPVLNRCSVGFFVAFFYFLHICIVIFLYFCLFFVGFYLPAVIWFDLEKEIVAGGRPSASLWFFCSSCFATIFSQWWLFYPHRTLHKVSLHFIPPCAALE